MQLRAARRPGSPTEHETAAGGGTPGAEASLVAGGGRVEDPEVVSEDDNEMEVPGVPSSFGGKQLSNAPTMLPVMYPLLVPGTGMSFHNQEPADHGPGLYAVPSHPFMGLIGSLPSNDLIPIRYTMPTRQDPEGVNGSDQGQGAREQHGPQGHVVRRFQFAIQIDVFLILKLLAVVLLFNQDGSKQKLIMLLLFAAVVYLHQTGALAPLVRWLRLQAAPPQPRPPVRAANGPLAPEDVNAPGEDQNQPEAPAGNENPAEAMEGGNAGNLWGIVQEIRMIVIGFITSLLPGFHHHHND